MLILVYIFFSFLFHSNFFLLSLPLYFSLYSSRFLSYSSLSPSHSSLLLYLPLSKDQFSLYLSFHTLYDSVCLSAFFSFSISLFLSITHSFFFLSISLFLETLSKGTRPPNLLCSQAASEFQNSN